MPSFTAFAVTYLLRNHFADFVDIGFTAEMEQDLDEISNGERPQVDFIRSFYFGDGKHEGLEPLVRKASEARDYPVIDVGQDPESSQAIRVRIGKFGPFLQRGDGGPGNTASLPDEMPPADLTVERAVELLNAKAAGPRELGTDTATGLKVYVNNGRFGPYVQLGETPQKAAKGAKAEKPRRASLPRGVGEADVTLHDRAAPAQPPPRAGEAPGDGPADRREQRALRAVRQARRRVPLAGSGRRRLYDRVGESGRATGGAEAGTAPAVRCEDRAARAGCEARQRGGHQAVRRPLRAVRVGRQNQRVAAQGNGSRQRRAPRSRRTPERPGGCRAGEEGRPRAGVCRRAARAGDGRRAETKEGTRGDRLRAIFSI